MSSGVWHRVVWWVGIDILDEPAATVFFAGDGGSEFLQAIGTYWYVSTGLHGVASQKTVNLRGLP